MNVVISGRRDLTTALKTRDRVAVSALRSALAAIENAEALPADHPGPETVDGEDLGGEHVAGSVVGVGAAEAERRHLTDVDLRAILEQERQERAIAARGYEQAGRHDQAQRLRSEADVLGRYLDPAE